MNLFSCHAAGLHMMWVIERLSSFLSSASLNDPGHSTGRDGSDPELMQSVGVAPVTNQNKKTAPAEAQGLL